MKTVFCDVIILFSSFFQVIVQPIDVNLIKRNFEKTENYGNYISGRKYNVDDKLSL